MLVTSVTSSSWSLDAYSLVPLICNFVDWESTGKLFKIQIICIECIIFKIRIIYGISVDNFANSFDLLTHPIWKLFKIRIICRISVDNFASSFDLSMHPIGNKLFKIWIICGISVNNFVSSFDLSMRPIEKLFKIRIICRISFDNFASSFDLLTRPIGKLFKILIICGLEHNGWWLPSLGNFAMCWKTSGA